MHQVWLGLRCECGGVTLVHLLSHWEIKAFTLGPSPGPRPLWDPELELKPGPGPDSELQLHPRPWLGLSRCLAQLATLGRVATDPVPKLEVGSESKPAFLWLGFFGIFCFTSGFRRAFVSSACLPWYCLPAS